MGYKVGQTLWFKYDGYSSRSGVDREVAITKIGRSWIYIDNGHRVDKETLIADGKGYASPGACYLSKKDYDEDVLLAREWRLFSRMIQDSYNAPEGVTVESIQKVRNLLWP